MRALTSWLLFVVLVSGLLVERAEAQPIDSPYAAELRQHYYEQLAKSPWRALGWELLLPGGGNYYVGLYVPALATLVGSLAGASMWLAGSLRSRPQLEYIGIGTFAAARGYGVVSAPIGAALLNAAFRRQLGLDRAF